MTTEAPSRDTSGTLPFLTAARGVFDLSFEAMLWSRRSLFLALLLCLPIALGVLFHAAQAVELQTRITGRDLYQLLVVLFYVRNALPLVALFYATSLIADEVEGRTLTFLLTRPVSRASVLTGKYAAFLATALTLTLPAVVVGGVLLIAPEGAGALGGSLPALLRDMAAMGLTLAAYGAAFTLLGVLLRRPVIPGLVFLFVWEFLANLPGYLPRFTLSVYARGLLPYRSIPGLGELFLLDLEPWTCAATLAAVSAAGLLLAIGIFSSREYSMSQ